MPSFDPSAPATPGSGLFGLDTPPGEAAVQVVPVPFDATTSFRPGAARGPDAVLRASHQVELYDLALGKPYEAGICLLDVPERVTALQAEAAPLARRVIEVSGNVTGRPELAAARERVNAIGTELNEIVRGVVGRVLDDGRLPVILGGDHSVPFGGIDACAQRVGELGVLHFDAHADLREAYEGFTWSHASTLHNVLALVPQVTALVQVGLRDLCEEEHRAILESEGRVHAVYDHEWKAARFTPETSPRRIVREALERLPDDIWITFDVDGLEPALCPNTGTPVPGGLSWDEAMLWLGELARSDKRVRGIDLVEVAPAPEGSGREPGSGIDEIVGARLLYRLIGTALR